MCCHELSYSLELELMGILFQTGEGVKDSRKGMCANHVSSMANFLKVSGPRTNLIIHCYFESAIALASQSDLFLTNTQVFVSSRSGGSGTSAFVLTLQFLMN